MHKWAARLKKINKGQKYGAFASNKRPSQALSPLLSN